MRGRKVYGQSKNNDCPFCGQNALSVNEQGVPVCVQHKERVIANFKCLCGDWLDLLKGKWGPFFRCMNCGTMNFRKGLELNRDKLYKSEEAVKEVKQDAAATKKQQQWQGRGSTAPSAPRKPTPPHKEYTVRSDELDFWFE